MVFRVILQLYCNHIIVITDNTHQDDYAIYLSTFSSHLYIRWVLIVFGMHTLCVNILFKKRRTGEAWYKTYYGLPHIGDTVFKNLVSIIWSFSSHTLYMYSIIQWSNICTAHRTYKNKTKKIRIQFIFLTAKSNLFWYMTVQLFHTFMYITLQLPASPSLDHQWTILHRTYHLKWAIIRLNKAECIISAANYIWSTHLQSELLRRKNRSKSTSAVSFTQLMPWLSC